MLSAEFLKLRTSKVRPEIEGINIEWRFTFKFHPLNKSKGPHKNRDHNTNAKKESSQEIGLLTTAEKICLKNRSYRLKEDLSKIAKNTYIAYWAIDFFVWCMAISDLLICCVCKSRMTSKQTLFRGLVFMIIVLCRWGGSEINSHTMRGNGFQIMRGIILKMSLPAVTKEGFPNNTYDALNKGCELCKTVFHYCCKKAVEEAFAEKLGNTLATDLPVTGQVISKKRDTFPFLVCSRIL